MEPTNPRLAGSELPQCLPAQNPERRATPRCSLQSQGRGIGAAGPPHTPQVPLLWTVYLLLSFRQFAMLGPRDPARDRGFFQVRCGGGGPAPLWAAAGQPSWRQREAMASSAGLHGVPSA